MHEILSRYALERDIRPGSLAQLRYSLASFESFLGKPPAVTDFNDDVVNRFILWLTEKKYARETIRTRRSGIMALWNAAADAGQVPPPRKVRRLAPHRSIPRAWTPAQVAAILAECSKLTGTFRRFPHVERAKFAAVLVDFNGRDYSPVLPEECVSSMPGICTGILLFDVLIANGDRHDENLLVDQMVDPRDIRVIDHDAALFGTNAGQGIERLKNLRARLGISSGPITGGNRHVFLDHLNTNEYMGQWIDTISWLPHPFITQVCTEAIKLGISKEEADEAAAFLCDRRINLRGILNRHHKQFSQVKPWKTV